jgi:hypothetical protein
MKQFSSLTANGTASLSFLKPNRVTLFNIFIVISQFCYGYTYTSTGATTNWNIATSWSGGAIGGTPGIGDNVVIASGTSITINTSPGTLGTITVDGTLEFQAGTARTLAGTNLTISGTGIFRVNASGTTTAHSLSLSGNIANNGTLDFYANSGSAAASITFTGSSNTTFSGAGATTDIYSITVNKGSAPTYSVDLTVSNFTVRGVSTDVAGFLTLTNGTFKISGSFAMTNRVFTTAGYTIASNTGFYLNNPNFTVAAQAGNVGWYGTVTIDAGTFNVGTNTDDNLNYYAATATYIINGGALNIAGSLQPYYDLNNYTYSVDYTQTGGTVTCCTVGNSVGGSTGKGFPSMWITQSSSFTMSGGTIVIRGQNILWNYDYDCSADTRSITGGTVQIGDASSGTAKRYGITGYFPNLVITNTSGNHSAEFYQKIYTPYIYLTTTLQSNTTLDANTNSLGATFVGDITMNSGSTFDAGTVTHTVKGNWINNGTLTYRTSTFYFNGSSLQTISGSANLNFYDVELNNSAGMALSPNTGVVTAFRHLLTFTSGKITLNDYDLELEASQDGSSGISGSYGSSNFIITNGTGVFRRFNIGSAAGKRTTALYPIGYTSSTYTPVTLNVTSTTTTDNFSARVSQGVYSSGTSGSLYTSKTVDRTWDVSEGTAGGSNIQLTFQWTSSLELTSFTRNSCYVGHYTGGAWQVSGNAAASGSNPYTRTSGTQTSFSPFAVASGSSTLPIELLSFDAKPDDNHVLAKWSTASEKNNDFFTLERSKDGASFEKLKTVPGAGNSDHVLNYSEKDEAPLHGISYYRLKQMDYDGKTSYSRVVTVEFNSNSQIKVSAGIYYVKVIINGTPAICKFVHY